MNPSDYRHSRPADLLETVGGDRATFALLVDIFKRDTADKLDGMRRALAQGDRVQLGFHTHAMKGTVGPTGADVLLRQLADLEAACRDPQGSVDLRTLDDIERQAAEIREELERFGANAG